MFETIKEFEDYLFSIKTDAQLKKAKYKEADCLAFYESLGDLARVQVYKDLTERIGQLIAKDRHSNMTIVKMLYRMLFGKKDLNTIIEKTGEEFVEHSEKFQMKYYPLVRAIVMNIQNTGDAQKTLMSEMADIKRMDEINRDENNQFIADALESKPILKEYKDQVIEMFQNGIMGVPEQLGKMRSTHESSYDEDDQNSEEELSQTEREKYNPNKTLEKMELEYKEIINSLWFQRALAKGYFIRGEKRYEHKITKAELTLFASLLNERLQLKLKWKPFEELFWEGNLTKTNNSVLKGDRMGRYGTREREIKKLFDLV